MCLCEERWKTFYVSMSYVRRNVWKNKERRLEQIEQLDILSQLQILLGVGWREKREEIRKIVLEYMKKAYEIRKKYIK